MKKEKMKFTLMNKEFESEFIFFDNSDKPQIKEAFNKWVSLNEDMISMGGTRIINFPETLSEAIFCLELNVARATKNISGTSSSFDTYNFTTNKRIQLKASASTGPSSFGPKSEYDELYFFYMNKIAENKKHKREFSGEYHIYNLTNFDIKTLVMNKERNETFQDQQNQGRRPRFSIPIAILNKYNINPIITGNIDNW